MQMFGYLQKLSENASLFALSQFPEADKRTQKLEAKQV